ncbi:MAG: phenylalanine--tRNA ligase subunit beta, partial [Actinomycetota bacterium]|nr:phenylalanine--tRNA ligase subunit beta [Actinomycetota bacterium]
AVVIENPMIEQEDRMRTTILPGLLRSVARNIAHRAEGVALFELAHVYEPIGGQQLPAEPLHLVCVCTGTLHAKGWRAAQQGWDFFALKGVLDALGDALGLGEPLRYVPAEGMPFHPTRAAEISFGGNAIGVIGELHPDVCDAFDVPEGTVGAEIAVDLLLERTRGRVPIGDLPRFPSTKIDVAVVVPDDVPADDVSSVIKEVGAPEVIAARLFDIYHGEQVPAGHKSLAYALELRVADRTLTDAEAISVRDRIVAALHERHGGELRS